jgi:hypothetical protein
MWCLATATLTFALIAAGNVSQKNGFYFCRQKSELKNARPI